MWWRRGMHSCREWVNGNPYLATEEFQYLLKISLLILRDIKFLLYRCKSETLTKAADNFVFWRFGGGGGGSQNARCWMQVARDAEMQERKMQNARERKFEFQLTSLGFHSGQWRRSLQFVLILDKNWRTPFVKWIPFSILPALIFS